MTGMKLLQINSTVNTCSHGRIAEELGMAAMAAGFRIFIAYGRAGLPSRPARDIGGCGPHRHEWQQQRQAACQAG